LIGDFHHKNGGKLTMKRKLVFLLPLLALLIGLLPLVVSAGGPWSDNFDSYADGTVLQDVGGWKGWGNDITYAAVVDSAQSSSAPHSVRVDGAVDAVHEYSETDGQWTYGGELFIPGNLSGQTYFILLNQYDDAGTTNNWSVQVLFDGAQGLMIDTGASGATMAYVADQWVPFRIEIDLDADTQDFYYNDTLFYSGTWSGHVSGGGITSIGAVDLFANAASPVYYDNLYLTTPVTAVALNKTVGFDPNACAGTDNVTIPAGYGGTEVTYCYTMLNTGDFTVTYHTVEDSELGTVLGPDFVLDVGPGDSVSITATVLITETTVNTATWYINDETGAVITSSTDVATVTRGEPTDVSLSAFGAESGIDAGLVWLGVLLVVVTGMGVALRRKATVER
jgi:hypothetical protein